MGPPEKTCPTTSPPSSLIISTASSVVPRMFPPRHHPVPYSVLSNTSCRYLVLLNKSTNTCFTSPTDCPYQVPNFATGTYILFREYTQRTNQTEVPSTPPSSPPPPDLINDSSSVPLFMLSHLPQTTYPLLLPLYLVTPYTTNIFRKQKYYTPIIPYTMIT